MSENKKKAAAIAAVKAVIDIKQNNCENAIYPLSYPTEPSAWGQWGKQMIMANRNMIQMRLSRKR